MAYSIEIMPTALESLRQITDRRTRDAILRRIDSLVEEPEQQGKPLGRDLAPLLSIRAAGQRYRVIYRVDRLRQKLVLVYLVGIRREGSRDDVYAVAERLRRRGLI